MDGNGHFDINQTLLCLFKLKCQAAHGILFCVAHNALNWDLFLDVVVVNVWFYSCSHAIKRERWQMVMMLKLLIILCHVSFHFLGFSLKLWSFNFPLAEHSVLINCFCLFILSLFLLVSFHYPYSLQQGKSRIREMVSFELNKEIDVFLFCHECGTKKKF